MRSPARPVHLTPEPASPCRRRRAPGARAPRPCAGARRGLPDRRGACPVGRCTRTRTGTVSDWHRRSAVTARRSRRSRRAHRVRRPGRSARRRCRAQRSRSRAPNRPRCGRARAGGSRCGRGRRTGALRPSARARTRRRAGAGRAATRSSRSRPSDRFSSAYSRASSSPISSLSEERTPGSMPSSRASSSVFVRLPLCPSEKPASATDR